MRITGAGKDNRQGHGAAGEGFDNRPERGGVIEAPPCMGVTTTGRDVDLGGVDVGMVVKAKGGVGTFRGTRQMLLERLCTSYASLSLSLCLLPFL